MLNSKLTTYILIAVCAILANLIYYSLKNPEQYSVAMNGTQSSQITLDPINISKPELLADISEYDEIIQRPLFSSNRQPEEIIEERVIKKPTRNPDLKLTGIVISEEEQVALIKSRRQPKLQRIKLEESIDGWKLTEINKDSVKLEAGDQAITLELTRKANPVQAQKNTQQAIKQKQNLLNNNKNPSQPAFKKQQGMNTSPARSETNQGPSSKRSDENESD